MYYNGNRHCSTKDLVRCSVFIVLFTFTIPAMRHCYSQRAPDKDSVILPASLKYKHPGIFLRLAMGNNYRQEWSTPVTMRVFDISKEQGGLTITKMGGGHQTKGLKMVSADGVEWGLRSVDKNVRKLLPGWVRDIGLGKMGQDLISASHPYACLSVAELANAIGVVNPGPELVYVPDDTALGTYQKEIGDDMYFFEKKHPLKPNTRPENMEDLLEGLQKDNTKIVLQREMLKARLLDMVTGDWDRHQGQWKWGYSDSINKKWYYPVPGDRDQAFFKTKGILTRLVNAAFTPFLKGFKRNPKGLYQLNKWALTVDRTFLNELSEADWKEIVQEVQNNLSDSVVNAAVNKLPSELSAKRKQQLARTLRSRRDGLLNAALIYYQRLAGNAYVFGSVKAEYFVIKTVDDNLQVTVYNNVNECDSCKVYQRIFSKAHTRRIYLVGIDNNDRVNIPPSSSIRINQIKRANDRKYELRRKMLERLKAKGQG